MGKNEKEKSIEEKLLAPFSFDEIGWRVGATFNQDGKVKGIAVPYITRVSIQDRLDNVFGLFGWKNEYKEWGTNAQLCGISFRVDNSLEWITKWDGAANTDYEEVKGGLSDSFKRAATVIGIGRYLSKIGTAYVDVDLKEKDNSKKIASISRNEFKTTLFNLYNKEVTRIFGNVIKNEETPPNNPSLNESVISKENTKDTPSKICNETPNKVNDFKAPEHLIKVLEQLIKVKNVNPNIILKNYKVKSLNELTPEQVDNAMSRLANTKVA